MLTIRSRKGTDYDPDFVAEAWYDLFANKTVAENTFPPGIMRILN